MVDMRIRKYNSLTPKEKTFRQEMGFTPRELAIANELRRQGKKITLAQYRRPTPPRSRPVTYAQRAALAYNSYFGNR